MSAGDERSLKAKQEGALGIMKKPVDERTIDNAFNLLINNELVKLNKVLIIEDSEVQSHVLQHQLAGKELQSRRAYTGAEALSLLENESSFDCIILDLSLPDIYGLDLLDKIKENKEWANIPVVINTAMELDQPDLERVMKYTHAMVLKSNRSNDRLLDEVNLFMNKISSEESNFPRSQKPQSGPSPSSATGDAAFRGKSILIVDDDMRNIFALTSALQPYELQVSIANNGVEALKKLDENPEMNIVLMDIMMPEMDGYEAMQEIRKQNRFAQLPIIALTAKAMKNDREKCIEAGANEYISKPVDVEKLVSLMRVWLS
jgi:CheY-like chemotaxis protein